MTWYKKHFPTTWAATTVLEDFVQIFMALGGPGRMLLIEEVHKPLDSTLWLWLPEADLLDVFPGFAAADPSELPREAILLAGSKARFAADFIPGSRKAKPA